MPDRNYISAIEVDPELIPGARNAIGVCLRLQPQERITIITDEATREIAAALQAGSGSGRLAVQHLLSRTSRAPALEVHAGGDSGRPRLLAGFVVFAAQTQPGELASRAEMTTVVNHHGIRHGHMVNINRQIMLEGMRADFREIDALSQRLVERARQAERVICRTPNGTDFQAELSPKLKWLKTSGLISKDKWGNLPGGEIFTAPWNTNGVFVVDGVVGDYLCERYGDLQSNPLTIEVENNRIRSLKSTNKDLRDDFRAYTSTDENSNRVGEFAIGTNTRLSRCYRSHLAGRKDSRRPHRVWTSIRRTHRCELGVDHAHRLCGPRFRHLVR